MRTLVRTLAAFATITVLSLAIGQRDAHAQFVVSDPTNLIQNTTSAFAEVQAVVNQVMEIQNQIKQLEWLAKDLKRLSASDWATLQSSYYRLESAYRQGKYISMRWGQIADEYDDHFEAYDPAVHDGQTYQQKRRKWNDQTDDAIRGAMVSHGVVDAYEARAEDLGSVVQASNSAEGTLAAIQAGNQISAMILKQLMELTELIVADSRARLSHIKEQSLVEDAQQKQKSHSIMRGYGESQTASGQTRGGKLPEIK